MTIDKITLKNRNGIREMSKRYGALLVFAFLIVINMIFTSNFVNINMLWNMSIQSFPIIMVGIGMTLVIATGGIDISVGATMAVTAVVATMLLETLGVALAIIIALCVSIFIGLFNGFMITTFKIQPIIVTLVLYISGRGIAQVLNDGYTITFYDNVLTKLGIFRVGKVPIQLIVVLIVFIIFSFIIKKTTFGFYIQSIGENAKASRLFGVKTNKIIISAYTIVALLCGIAAIFEASRSGSADPNAIGKLSELDAIAAVAVGGSSMSGGRINLTGTFFGALIMQLITVSINMNNIMYSYSLVIKAIVIVAAIYLQREK